MAHIAKQQKTQQFCFKLHSSFLEKHKWDLTLPIEEARLTPGVVISLADSQILTWINELNGTEDYDEEAKRIKAEIKRKKNHGADRRIISMLYSRLYKLQFKEDYLCLIIDKTKHYDRANAGFKVNGVEYRRLLTTTNGVKTSTVVYTSVRMAEVLKDRIDNGRNHDVELVPAKLGAYQALCSSASIPVSWPRGTIVVSDCFTEFDADVINIDDSDATKEPVVEFAAQQRMRNNASDGCGMMLPSLSRRWNGELGGDPEHTVAGCNVRCAWTKGMVFTFDYVSWAEAHGCGYEITDVWGNKHDIRDSELILTESQLKLWKSYDNWLDYYSKCIENHYTMRIAKTAPHENDDVRQLNYQFIQPHKLDNSDVSALVMPTVSEIMDIMRMDYRKSIVYLCGSKLDEENVMYSDPAAMALMVNQNMIEDPYIFSRIQNMIQKRIREAKIGVLNVHGNFQIISGDLVALCESMFGMPPAGVLKAGEVYSQYWRDNDVSRVVCYRAPMSNAHSIRMQEISYSDEAAKWFEYIDTCMVVNAWDTMPQALNGFDYDGDLVFSTDNSVLLKTYEPLPALNCIQYNASKKRVREDDIVVSNKMGFGSKIGQITNRITAMTSLMSNYDEDSPEYRELKYRTQCGQAQQQAEIDKAKGILPTPMPKTWYVYSANKNSDSDGPEEIERKELYRKICASKKPYFFGYNYPSLKKEYDAFISNINEKSEALFQMSFKDLLKFEHKTDNMHRFVSWAQRKLPLDMSPSVMNKICWMVESCFDSMDFGSSVNFDYSMLKSGGRYSLQKYKEIEVLYKSHMRRVSEFSKRKHSDYYEIVFNDIEHRESVDQLKTVFAEKCRAICQNEHELCDILVDMCYKGRGNKEIVWYVCGKTIVDNLLKHNNYNLYFPKATSELHYDFECMGARFVMQKVKVDWREEE